MKVDNRAGPGEEDAPDGRANDRRGGAHNPGGDAEQSDNISTLLEAIVAALRRFVALSNDEAYYAVALWIVVTHVLPMFEFAPPLAVTSAVKGSGKSRLLDVIGHLVLDPDRNINISPAALVRLLNQDPAPTVLIDEADGVFTHGSGDGSDQLRRTINAAFRRGQRVSRAGGPNFEQLRQYNVFGMICLAGIGELPDTITSRAIVLPIRKRLPDEKIESFRARDGDALEELRRRIVVWAEAWMAVTSADDVVEGLDMPVEDREADTWEPLVAIGRVAGEAWAARARAACVAFTKEADPTLSLPERLLADIRVIVADRQGTFIGTDSLIDQLEELPESEWEERKLTPRALAAYLRPFEVRPCHDAKKTKRGYVISDLRRAWERHVPDVEDSDTSDGTDGNKAVR